MKRWVVHLLLVASLGLVPLASECSGNGNYDRWCYGLNCDGRHNKK